VYLLGRAATSIPRLPPVLCVVVYVDNQVKFSDHFSTFERVQTSKHELNVGPQRGAHDGIAVENETSVIMLSLNHDAAATPYAMLSGLRSGYSS